ncbi:MAG: helix-turn-helix domain-containing protein [Bacteroidota bacterium]
MEDQFQNIRPLAPEVTPYIDCYYFHTSNNPELSRRLFYYPSYRTALNVYKNVTVRLETTGRTYQKCDAPHLETVFTNAIDHVGYVHLAGDFDKIGVLFNPYGFNAFLPITLQDFLKGNKVLRFDGLGDKWNEKIQEVFETASVPNKRDLLDQIFKSLLQNHLDTRFLQVLHVIEKTDGNIRLHEIVEELGFHRKTITRWCNKHLGMPFREYAGIVKFRRTLERHEGNKPQKLVELAYQSNYYDQADFINHFKSMSATTPKHLFKSLKSMGAKVYWNYS